MRIKTKLPHEFGEGHTLALFGKPIIRLQPRMGHSVYIDCHIITATEIKHGFTFERIFLESLPLKMKYKMIYHARKLVAAHIQKKKGWKIKTKVRDYIQNNCWCGFNFHIDIK